MKTNGVYQYNKGNGLKEVYSPDNPPPVKGRIQVFGFHGSIQGHQINGIAFLSATFSASAANLNAWNVSTSYYGSSYTLFMMGAGVDSGTQDFYKFVRNSGSSKAFTKGNGLPVSGNISEFTFYDGINIPVLA